MDFTSLTMILRPAAALCIGWAFTLIGNKVDGSNVNVVRFGPDGADKLADDEREKLLAIFQQERSSADLIEHTTDNVIEESIEDAAIPDEDAQEMELEELTEAVEKEISESLPDQEESEVIAKMVATAPPTHGAAIQHISSKPRSLEEPIARVPKTPKLDNFLATRPQTARSQARLMHFIEEEDGKPDEDKDVDSDADVKISEIRQPNWAQAGSSDEEESQPAKPVALSLPLADDVLNASLSKLTLEESHASPIAEKPTRQLRRRQKPNAPGNSSIPEPSTRQLRGRQQPTVQENPPVLEKPKRQQRTRQKPAAHGNPPGVAIVLEPQAVDPEDAVPKLTFTAPAPSRQFTYGTQIMQYGRAEYEWKQDLAAPGYIEVLAETKWGEKLITTPYLKRLGLSFNTLYQLIICIQCAEGLPISYVYTHLSNLDARRVTKNSIGEWAASKVAYESIHPWPISKLPPNNRLQEEISTSLRAAGFTVRDLGIDPNFGAASTPAWAEIPLPSIPTSERPQVLGLRTFDRVWKCTVCDGIRATKSSITTHMSQLHKGSQLAKNTSRVYAQTLSEVPGWTNMFEVSKLPTALVSEKQGETENHTLDRSATLALLRNKKATALDGIEVVPDKEVRTVPPVFLRTGIDQFLSPFNRKALYETITPDRTDPEYQELRDALLPSFVSDVEAMKTDPTHHSIYTSITNCTPGQPRQRRPFAALTTPVAIASYGLLQVKLVWALIMAYRVSLRGPKHLKKNLGQFFKFDDAQRDALESLSDALEEGESLEQDLDVLLHAIYFPSKNTTADSIFNSPIIAFIASLCLSDDGSYRTIHLIPPPVSKIQFLMRLSALCTFNRWRNELGTNGDQDAWLSRCKQFCERYLQDQNLAPFASVRYLLHLTSVAAKSTPRPDFVWWTGNTVKVGDHTVDFDQFSKFLSFKIKETEEFVEKSVLLGTFTLTEIEEKFKVSSLKDPSGEDDVLGNGVLFDARNNTLDNPESAEVFFEMFQKGCLGMRRDATGNLRFDQNKCMSWISDIHKALSIIQALCHITQGPGPGRMSEECIHSPTNSMNCARNFAFDEQEGTGGFRSGYNKTSFVTDDQKIIFRLIPYCIFRLLWVLIRLIRAIELTVLLEFIVITQDDRQNLVNIYKERIWASWGQSWTAVDLSRNLQEFMYQGTGSKIGARSYRHLAIALQRHFPTTSYDRYNTERDIENRNLARAADLMAGHSVAVSDMNYARKPGVTTSEITKAHFVRVSKDWHALLGIPTKLEDRK